jgi:hypothetical protein
MKTLNEPHFSHPSPSRIVRQPAVAGASNSRGLPPAKPVPQPAKALFAGLPCWAKLLLAVWLSLAGTPPISAFTVYDHNVMTVFDHNMQPKDTPVTTQFTDCADPNRSADHWSWDANNGTITITYWFDSTFTSMFSDMDLYWVTNQIILAMTEWSRASQRISKLYDPEHYPGYDAYGQYDSYSRATQILGPVQPFMDVRSATLHELGHVLGFAHPDDGVSSGYNFAYEVAGRRGLWQGPGYSKEIAQYSGYYDHDKNPYYYWLHIRDSQPPPPDQQPMVGFSGQEVMSYYSFNGGRGRQPGELYHILTWDELDGFDFLYQGAQLVFQLAENEAAAKLVFYGVENLPEGPTAVCKGIPYGHVRDPNHLLQGSVITNAEMLFNRHAEYPFGCESVGWNYDITYDATYQVIMDVTGTDNANLVDHFDNFPPYWDGGFLPPTTTYLGDPTSGSPNSKDSIQVTWTVSGDPRGPGTFHLGVQPDVWDWTTWPVSFWIVPAVGANTNGPFYFTPVHQFAAGPTFYGYAATATQNRNSSFCLTTVSSNLFVGVQGFAVTSSQDGTHVSNLQIADVTGMGLSLSNLNRALLAQLQASNQMITISNAMNLILNSNDQYVVIMQGSASYLPTNILASGHYTYLNRPDLIGRQLFASVVNSNNNVRVGNYSLIGVPPVVSIAPPPNLSIRPPGTNGVVIAWPFPSSGYLLQANTNLGTSNWVYALTLPAIVGNEYQFSIPPTADSQFYRLVRAAGAADNASDAAYNSGWYTGTNGGVGFSTWSLSTSGPGYGGFFIYDSSANGSGNSGNINTPGNRSWGIYANLGNLSEAVRPFLMPLATNQTLMLDMDNGLVNSSNENPVGVGPGRVGFGLRSGNATCFEFYYNGDDFEYRINDASGSARGTKLALTDGGLHFQFNLTNGNGYSLTVTPNGGSTRSFTGTLLNSGPISNVRLFNYSAGEWSPHDLYFNSLQIAP